MANSTIDSIKWPHGPAVLGCGNFGGIGGNLDFLDRGMDAASSFAAMDEAVDLGVTLFDTAERYAAGESERIIGRWLASRANEVTDSISISTKVGPPWLDRGDGEFDQQYIEPIFTGSLERLGVGAVDILYSHAPDDHSGTPNRYEPTPIEVTLEAFEAIRQSGRVRLVGASNINFEQLATAIQAAERIGIVGYQVIQNGYNLLEPDGDSKIRDLASRHGIAYTAYSALASGVLTGKYKKGEAPPKGSLVDVGYLNEIPGQVLDAVGRLRSAAVARDEPTGALALAWLITHPRVSAITTAPSRRPPHLSLLRKALNLEVSDAEFDEWRGWFDTITT